MPFLYVTTQATCTSSVPTNNLPSSHSPTLQSNLSRSVQSELVQVTYACSASSGSLKWAISSGARQSRTYVVVETLRWWGLFTTRCCTQLLLNSLKHNCSQRLVARAVATGLRPTVGRSCFHVLGLRHGRALGLSV